MGEEEEAGFLSRACWRAGREVRLYVLVFDRVGLGCTGPRDWRRACRARSGSWESRFVSAGMDVSCCVHGRIDLLLSATAYRMLGQKRMIGCSRWVLPSAILGSGYSVGLSCSCTFGRRDITFVRLEEGGGGRVGYLRAVFEAESFEAVFAALEVEEPIVAFAAAVKTSLMSK